MLKRFSTACGSLFVILTLGWALAEPGGEALTPGQEPPYPGSSVTAFQDAISSRPTTEVQQVLEPTLHRARLVHSYPHDAQAFTQGLVFEDGYLYESTGLPGRSTLRKVELETGKVVKSFQLPSAYFAEGLTVWRDKLMQLTWKSGICFVYEKDTFRKLEQFGYETEGWGLTTDGESLIMSDGSDRLCFFDPENFNELCRISVKDRGSPVYNLNELEFIKGEVVANIWQSDFLVRISPKSGRVTGWIDLSALRTALGPVKGIDVLNGIAYDRTRGRVFVTGKFWPRLFEIEIDPPLP